MANIPSGTVTFLFTDIEGSTKLARADAVSWAAMRDRHHAIVRQAFDAQHGYIFQVIGDAFCAAFSMASDAVAAAVAAQRALQTDDGGSQTEAAGSQDSTPVTPPQSSLALRVRMGIHTGAAEWRDGDYDGYLTLARVQRIMAAAHGGQVLLSHTMYDLVRGQLGDDVSVRDLGAQRLKDFPEPEHVYQLVISGLPSQFPPLKTLDARPNNLPIQPTSFIGRERELDAIRKLLQASRDDPTGRLYGAHLLTLTGVGGTGKTRLALQVAADLTDLQDPSGLFTDGVWLVELAPLADPALVPQTVASVFNLREEPGRPLMAALNDYLRAKNLLLILDNCEHLLEACAQLATTLLRSCPNVKILATSREALGIAGETIFHVPSLSVPVLSPELRVLSKTSQDSALSTQDLLHSDAVRLFVDRAVAIKSDFQLTDANAPAIVQICQRVDGIPLALELAAARVKSLSVEDIAARLNNQFRLLTGGSRTALPRQQTLSALIDWSYNLLSEPERVLFRRLSVFAGGWTLDSAEQVCSDDALVRDDVLDLLDSLVNKSLVVAETQDGTTRNRMLETIRQYAREKLLESAEGERLRDRHVDYVEHFVRTVDANIRVGDVRTWSDLGERERDNIRAALEWALTRQPLAAMRILSSMLAVWGNWGDFTEGEHWCAQALAHTAGATDDEFKSARARVYMALAALTMARGDNEAARRASEESLRLYRELGRPAAMAEVFSIRVLLVGFSGEMETAAAEFQDGLALARAAHDTYTEMILFSSMARTVGAHGDFGAAERYIEQSANLAREIGSQWGIGTAMMVSGWLAIVRGDYRLARARLEESHGYFLQMGGVPFTNVTRSELAHVARLLGEDERAVQLYREVILVWKHEGHRAGMARCFECLAFIAGAQAQPVRAARLFGAAEALRESAHAVMMPEEQVEYAQHLQQIRANADQATFNAAWNAGRQMTLEQAIQLALSDE